MGQCLALGLVLLFNLASPGEAEPVIRDGGINPANLGKGDWIYFVSQATNKLGGAAPSVVNIPTLMTFYKTQGLQYIIVKAGTGSTNFNGGESSAQFNSNLVYHAHAVGLLIFAYTRSYDDDVAGEIAMASRCFALGADGWVIDAEAEWESGASQAGTNGPTRALQYGQGLRALFPTKFIAHAPFPIISFHSSFPYREFGYYCDAVMPQAYWKSIYGNDPAAVSTMVSAMDNEYRNWQNTLAGDWTNSIKPIVPIGQAYNPSSTEITTAAEVDEFFDRLRTNQNPASITGYRGASFWRADTKPASMWTAVRTNVLGDGPGSPILTLQPQSRTVPLGTSNVSFTAWGTGSKPFYYRWRFNGTLIPGATSPTLTLSNVQFSHAGSYSVLVSNVSGVVISQSGTLNVSEPPALLDISAVTGARSAIISWTSVVPSSSRVEFGLTPVLNLATAEDTRLTTNHSILVTGLQPGTTYHYAVVSKTVTNMERAAGWTFATAGELVMDNTAADFTGNWSTGSSSLDKFGADYRYAGTVSGGSTASAIFTPIIDTPGLYDVFVWHPAGSNRTTNAPLVINYAGGAKLAKVNQTVDGGSWRQVGTNLLFRTAAGGNIRIANNAFESNKVVMADGVRLVYRLDQEMPTGATVPDWWAQHYFGGSINAALDHDGDGHPSWAEYLVGTNPRSATSRLMLWAEAAANNTLPIYFHPALPGRRYRLEEQTAPGTSWLPVGVVPVVNSSTGVGAFAMTNTQLGTRFYRLRVEWEQ
jgi:hypothetical protein